MDKAAELKAQLSDYIVGVLTQDKFKENLKSILKDELRKVVLSKKDTLLETEAYKNIKLALRRDMIDSLRSENFKKNIYTFIDNSIKSMETSDKTLDSLIPPAFLNSIKVYIYNNSDSITSSIKEIITSKNAEKRITAEITNVLNGLNPMISRFISSSTIYTRLVAGVNDYLNDDKNITDIINLINKKLDETMKKRVTEFTAYFPAEGRKSLVNSITTGIIDNILSDRFVDMSLEKLEEVFKAQLLSINENSEVLSNQMFTLVDNFFEDNYMSLLENNKSKELLDLFSGEIVENLLNKPIIELL